MIQHFKACNTEGGSIVTVGTSKMFFANVSKEQLALGLVDYLGGSLIQHAFPFLTDDQREFLMTGLTPDEFDQLF